MMNKKIKTTLLEKIEKYRDAEFERGYSYCLSLHPSNDYREATREVSRNTRKDLLDFIDVLFNDMESMSNFIKNVAKEN